MTFPQPVANDAALGGQTFFRLKTPLQSPGDLFESAQGALAFALGPDSDLASFNVYYYNPLDQYFVNGLGVPTLDTSKVGSFNLSPDRAFIGLIGADMNETYPLTGQPGRILIAAGDIVDPTWKSAAGVAGDAYIYQPIILDVIQYFSPVASLIAQRSDKTYRYQWFNEGADPLTDDAYLVLPAYGRKSGYFTIINRGLNPHDIEILGVNLVSLSTGGQIESSLFTSAALAVGASAEWQYDSSVDGTFDLLVLRIALYDQAEPLFTTIRLSDDPL